MLARIATAGAQSRRLYIGALDLLRGRVVEGRRLELILHAGTALLFLLLFWTPATTLWRDWWNDPEAAHGLLLAPVAVWLAWRGGIREGAQPQRFVGISMLAMAVLVRYASELAAELFTMRMSLLLAAGALLVWRFGFRQLLHWWLPTSLLILSVPLPDVILGSLALPLQFKASQMGAALLEWRHVPVLLAGNVINLPGGRSLFVTEACSGLRSLTALLSLGLLIGGLWLRSPWLRGVLVASTIPVAMVLNGIRIFLTGFLVYFVDPALGEGLMHYTEGWVLFVVAFAALGFIAWALMHAELLGKRGLRAVAHTLRSGARRPRHGYAP